MTEQSETKWGRDSVKPDALSVARRLSANAALKRKREVRREISRTREFDTLRDLCSAVLCSDGSGAVTERERLRAWGNIVTLAKIARQHFEAQQERAECRCERSTGLRIDLEPCEPGKCPAVFTAEPA